MVAVKYCDLDGVEIILGVKQKKKKIQKPKKKKIQEALDQAKEIDEKFTENFKKPLLCPKEPRAEARCQAAHSVNRRKAQRCKKIIEVLAGALGIKVYPKASSFK